MKILIAGDFVPLGKSAKLIDAGHYNLVLGEIPDITSNVDYSLVNLEAPVILGKPTPIFKSGPSIFCRETALDAIAYAGFNCVTLANNHFYDQSDYGVCCTLEGCQQRNLDYVGGGCNIEDASRILYKNIGDKCLAIINCCEKEFSIADINHGGSNPMDPIRIYYSIVEAKLKADYVLLITHGGIEFYHYPYPQMQELYRFFVDAGADAVVNHHQHCISGYEVYQGKPIFYGLGNFCFESKISNEMWYNGYMVELSFDVDNISFSLYYYKQSLHPNVGIQLCNADEENQFSQLIKKYNDVIADSSKLKTEFDKYLDGVEFGRLLNLEPLYNKSIRSLMKKNLLPRLIRGRALTDYYDRLSCVTHNVIISSIIRRKIKY